MPERLISYYGDDFTGSTDVMEALAGHGIETVLFTRKPADAEFRPFTDYRAFGLAGTSRSQKPEWMDAHLPDAFAWLKSLGARFCHYKVCSTFDSSPSIGSIGKAIDIGRRVFDQELTPLVVGAPQLKRFTFHGNLFAAYQGEVYRIDRHPVMSRHPVTPMDEADLRIHLGRQTKVPVRLATEMPAGGIAMLDVFDLDTQREAGIELLRRAGQSSLFIAGSSGVEYALVRALDRKAATFDPLGAVDRIAVVSGSVSPTTERQIRHALANGFEGLELDPVALASENGAAACEAAIAQGVERLKRGRSIIAYTALGSASDRGKQLSGVRNQIGAALGRVARGLIAQGGLTRFVFAGGDTSSHALGQLDIFALTTRFPLKATPGSPLCRAHSGDPALDGLELAMKGGQLGGDDYFAKLRDGLSAA
jgi:3-oxoisoapionate kinase